MDILHLCICEYPADTLAYPAITLAISKKF